MKKYYLGLVAVVAGLSACNESAVELTPQIQGEGVYATIEQPVSPVETKSLNWSSDNSLKFTWASNENVVVFGDGDAALLRSKTAGEASTKLESKGFDLKEGVNYYAFIPSSTFNIDAEATKVLVTFLGQRQTANNSTAHLKNYDYACASATVEDGKSLSFNLANQVAWIVLQHSCKQALNNVTSITFSVPDKVFISNGKLDVTVPEYGSSSHVNSLTLDLGKAGSDGISFGEGELMRVFLTVNPVDLTGKKLTITANLKDGSAVEIFNATLESANITRNTPAIITTEGSADVKSVASVNGVEYSSLQGAINAVLSGTLSATITLMDDVNGEFEVNDTRTYSSFRTVTIDLKGHTISSSSDSKAVVTLERGELYLKNGNIKSENFVGTKLGSNATKAYLYLVDCNIESAQGAACTGRATGSKIIIYGGTLSATNNAVIAGNGSNRSGYNIIQLNPGTKGNVPVINASVADADAVACGIYAPWKDVITINAAEINVENGVGILSRGGQITIEDAVIRTTGGDRTGLVADSKIQVPCKTLYLDKDCNYPALPDAYIRVKGGKYSDKAGAEYLYDKGYSYTADKNADDLYEVVVNEDILKAAYDKLAEGDILTVDNYVSMKSAAFNIKKDLTLNLSEKAFVTAFSSVADVFNFCKEGGKVNIAGDGTISAPENGTISYNEGIWVNAKGLTVTIDGDVTIKGGKAKNMSSAIDLCNGKLVINGGKFISGVDEGTNDSPVIYLDPTYSKTAELEINGGVFESVSGNAKYLINCQDDCISKCKISIKGGTFVGWNPAESKADVINGKPANWVADGYVATKITYEGKDAWKVEKAQTVSTTQDFNDALSSASAGDAVSVVLASNATVELTSGVANEGSKAHDITIVGDGTQTFDVVSKSVDASEGKQMNYQRGSSFTLKNLKIKAGEETYAGIVCDEITLVNCVITEGKLTLYSKATFVDCTFENEMENQYSIWTWGGTEVKFENCIFNTNGKAILIYGVQTSAGKPTNLTVSGCEFNDRKNGAAGKAVLEVGGFYGSAYYNLNMENCKINGFAKGKVTDDIRWANKDNMPSSRLSVTIDGEKVY